ncbi:hypothetical protein LG329_18320 [Virgibacillus necropolis]|uniref:hypothetical protein n=1 Tax=Virgibacillus necropolis TaxID=163877 RepID=UPI00384B4883
MINLLYFSIVFAFCYFIQRLFLKKEFSSTASGAIVMGNGIFLYSAMQQFPSLYDYGEIFAFILAAVWALIVISIISTIPKHSFKKRHFPNSIHVFAIGTWVAGTSVLGNVIHQFSLNLGIFPYIMGILNVALYIWYMYHIFKAYREIFRTSAKNQVHGVILLSTVSTQSIVLLLFNIFNKGLPDWGSATLIGFGILLYCIGLYLIFRRYVFIRNWNMKDDWKNTNCILHGAISITGLATVTTGVFNYNFILLLWIWVIALFVIVEGIEISRIIIRIKSYGLVLAIGSYDESQWSRNFTFGMLYAFTARFQMDTSSIFYPIRNIIIEYGPWVVLLFLVNEILLFFKVKWNKKRDLKQGEVGTNGSKA